MSQFYFKEKVPAKGDIPEKEIEVSFNLDKVVYSIMLGDRLTISLDDFHEVVEEEPIIQEKGQKKGEITGYRKVKGIKNTTFYLQGDDILKFKAKSGGQLSSEEFNKLYPGSSPLSAKPLVFEEKTTEES